MQSITGTGALNLRFPGQWFQLETGLHYNWHRSYDPTVGRYTQPDPLGFVDGPSVYGYAGGSPQRWADPDGRILAPPKPAFGPSGAEACAYGFCGGPFGKRDPFCSGPEMGGGGGGGGGAGRFRTPGPSQKQDDRYKKQLETDGRKSLEKSQSSLEKQLQEHQQKLEQIRKDGGYTSSVEREIRNFRDELSVIEKLLGK